MWEAITIVFASAGRELAADSDSFPRPTGEG
jgi:hypothetical protein